MSNSYLIFAKKAILIVKLVFTPLAIGFISYYAYISREILLQTFVTTKIENIIVAIILWVMLHFLNSFYLSTTIKALGSNISYLEVVYSHSSFLPARYLPGGIWHTVARFVDLRSKGAKTQHLSAFLFLENTISLAIALVFGGIAVYVFKQGYGLWSVYSLSAIVFGVTLLVIGYPIINKYILRSESSMRINTYLRYMIFNILFWFVSISSFLAFITAFPVLLQPVNHIEIGGYYLFSWAIGNIAVFAPQGIGVFEVTLKQLLGNMVLLEGTIALIASFRVVVLVADIVMWLSVKSYLLIFAKKETC